MASDADVALDILDVALWGMLAELRKSIQRFYKHHAGKIESIRFDGKRNFGTLETWGLPTPQDEELLPLRESFAKRLEEEQDNLRQVFCTLEQQIDSRIRLLHMDLASHLYARQQGQQCCAEALAARVRDGLEEFKESSVRRVENTARWRWVKLWEELQEVLVGMEDESVPRPRRRRVRTPRKTVFFPFEQVSEKWQYLLIPPLPAYSFSTNFKLPDITRPSACHQAY